MTSRGRIQDAKQLSEDAMRRLSDRQIQMFICVDLESRIPTDHPIRVLKKLCEQALKSLSCALDGMYSETGRPSVPPQRLLKSQLLIALYSLRSDRMFRERLKGCFAWHHALLMKFRPSWPKLHARRPCSGAGKRRPGVLALHGKSRTAAFSAKC